jgi:O-antigen ligase
MAAAIGTAAIIVFHERRARVAVTRAIPLLAAAAAAFVLMPSDVQERVTTFSAGANSPAAYAISLRQEYSEDAKRIISEHPWTGVGVGNYLAGDPSQGTQTDEPHQVLLLLAAEGGYGLAVSFVVLVLGSVIALRRMRSVHLAAAAAAVLIATVAHGLVDVYWVRGTPLIGWLLVGMTCGAAAGHRDRPRA